MLCTYLLAIWSGAPNETWPRTWNSSRRPTIKKATFGALQKVSCTEARQGLSELQPLSNPGEGAAVTSRKTSGKLFAFLWTGAQC
jgi:hypothetical protein